MISKKQDFNLKPIDTSFENSPELRITKEDLHDFPEINNFVEDLIKDLQERDRAIINKNAEIDSLNNLLIIYRDYANPLHNMTRIKEITSNFENEKRTLIETNIKILEDKALEITNLKKDQDLLLQDKNSLIQINESLQNELIKLQNLLSSTNDKFQILQTETQRIQSLLQESQAENQITKAKLTEYEEISNTIQEFQFKAHQIQKENQEALEINRKSFQGLEQKSNEYKLMDDMVLEEEIKRLDRLSHKLEGFSQAFLPITSIELSHLKKLFKSNRPTSNSHKDVKLPRTRTLEDIVEKEYTDQNLHRRMTSEITLERIQKRDYNENKYNNEEIKDLRIINEVISFVSNENDNKEQKKEENKGKASHKRHNNKSQTIVPIIREGKKLRRSRSCEVEELLDDGKECFIQRMKEKIDKCFDICENLINSNRREGTIILQNKDFDFFMKNIHNLRIFYEKFNETIEKFSHQKMLQNLEMGKEISKISYKLKEFLKEKHNFEKGLNEILDIFERNNDKEEPISSSLQDNVLLRFKKVIQNSLFDQQAFNSQNLELNDIFKEKSDLERDNKRLKKQNQAIFNNINTIKKTLENVTKERDVYYTDYLKCKEDMELVIMKLKYLEEIIKTNDIRVEEDIKLNIDDIVKEFDEENDLFLRNTSDAACFEEILDKFETLDVMKRNLEQNDKNLMNIFTTLKEFT